MSNAEELYRYNLARLDAEGMLPQDGVEALIFLATRCKVGLECSLQQQHVQEPLWELNEDET